MRLDAEGGLTLPAEVLERHNWKPGDSVLAMEGAQGLVLTSMASERALPTGNHTGRELEAEAVPPGAPTMAP